MTRRNLFKALISLPVMAIASAYLPQDEPRVNVYRKPLCDQQGNQYGESHWWGEPWTKDDIQNIGNSELTQRLCDDKYNHAYVLSNYEKHISDLENRVQKVSGVSDISVFIRDIESNPELVNQLEKTGYRIEYPIFQTKA